MPESLSMIVGHASASRARPPRPSSSLMSARSFGLEQSRESKPRAPNSYRCHQRDGHRWSVDHHEVISKAEMQEWLIISKPENFHENTSCPRDPRCCHRGPEFRPGGFERACIEPWMVVQGARLCAEPLRTLVRQLWQRQHEPRP